MLIDSKKGAGPVSVTDIDPERYIGLSENDPTARMLDILLEEAGIPAKTHVRVRTHFMAAELVRLGGGCAIVDAVTALHHPGLSRPRPLSPPLSVTCTVLFRADHALSHISQDILALLRSELDVDLLALKE